MNKWILGSVFITVMVCAALIIYGSQDRTTSDSNTQVENYEQYDDKPDTINNLMNNKQKSLDKPEVTIDSSASYTVTLVTTEGEIVIELDTEETPITTNNFIYLANNDFYDNTIFHRVIKDFMIQGGDPTGTGMGNPGYRFDDEPITKDYTRGTVAMANSGPNTNGSQFFIMHGDTPLPKNYVIFGKVIEGMEVVDKIAEAEVKVGSSGEKSTPISPVQIQDVVVASK